MQTVQLNIGLQTNLNEDLNIHFVTKVVNFVLNEKLYMSNFETRLDHSETEATAVIRFKTSASAKHIYPIITFLSDAFLQDCIAIKVGNEGKLVYSNNPKKDWGTFNEKYFINF